MDSLGISVTDVAAFLAILVAVMAAGVTRSRSRPAPCNVDRAGFTLLELIIVLLVAAVLSGMTLPRAGALQTRFAVKGSLNAFMSAHALARTTAVRQGGVAELHIDSVNHRFWVEVDTSFARVGLMDTVGVVVDLSEEMVTLSSTQSMLCFDGRGLPSTASGCATGGATVEFTRLGEVETIQTTALGKVLR